MGTVFPPPDPDTQTARQDLAMAGLLGTSLCGALLGLLCMSGEEGAGRDAVRAGAPRPGLRALGLGVGRGGGVGGLGWEGALGLRGGFNPHRTVVFLSLANTPSYLPSLRPFTHKNPAGMGSSLPETSGFKKARIEGWELSSG